MNTFSTNTITI